jgi:hypothetical protein
MPLAPADMGYGLTPARSTRWFAGFPASRCWMPAGSYNRTTVSPVSVWASSVRDRRSPISPCPIEAGAATMVSDPDKGTIRFVKYIDLAMVFDRVPEHLAERAEEAA